jgi:hypothetical protein
LGIFLLLQLLVTHESNHDRIHAFLLSLHIRQQLSL